MAEKKGKPQRSDYRKFGVSIGCVFLLITGLLIWSEHHTAAWVTGSLGGFLILAGLVLPGALALPYRPWMAFAHGLGWFNTRLLLTLFYYLVLSPMGLLMRILGKRPLDMKWDPEAESYWIPRKQIPFESRRCEKHF